MSFGSEMTNFDALERTTPNGFAWAVLGIPSILAWVAAGLCWFLEPRLAIEVYPLAWAAYAALGWYAFLIVIFGGLLGIIVLTSTLG